MNIVEKIGEPAALEQLAEEAAELAQAALKLARIERAENPTPKTKEEAIENLIEEMADVQLCVSVLSETEWYNLTKQINTAFEKLQRWKERISNGTGKDH